MAWWLNLWWQSEVVDGHKGPLLLSFVAFVVTFVATRTITRLIRAGKGPFHDVSSGGVHMHHSTPGVLLLIAGGFTAVGSPPLSGWTHVAGAMVGIGAALVLDEFAMLFRLQDVYWSQEGQLSVNVVTLAAACVGLAAVGVSPANVKGLAGAAVAVRIGVIVMLLIHLVLVAVTALKGKYPTALISLFISPVAWLAAVRLARPSSPWARRRYSGQKLARAQRRAATFDHRWGAVRRHWDNAIGGVPTTSAEQGHSIEAGRQSAGHPER
jgi:ABC-type multidrug transport system fused ATPase/permease subunit